MARRGSQDSKVSPPPRVPPRHGRQTTPSIIFDDDEYCNSLTLKGMVDNRQNSHEDEKYDDDEFDNEDYENGVCEPPSSPSNSGTLPVHRGSSSSSDSAGPSSQVLLFKKSGADAFLFSTPDPVPISVKAVTIVNSQDGPLWKPVDATYACTVTAPKKESKLGGMKTYITYQLTPTFSNIQVSRRYKQFTWLYQRLTEKFTTLSISPLPEKSQFVGKFEQDFINDRLRLLQMWISRICKHPVVSHADVFLHFLTCTDDKKWSRGKRVAERDEFVRGRWFSTIQAPTLNSHDAELKVDQFSRFVRNMDEGLRQMASTCEHNVKKHDTFKKEYQKLGTSFQLLAKSFELDERSASVQLTRAVEHTGKTYEEIGSLFGAQPSVDIIYLMDVLQEYRGILNAFPSSIAIHKESLNKVKEKADKLNNSERQAVQKRADVITSSVMADMLYFQEERVTDFKNEMCHYLEKQIEFHSTITARLREALEKFKRI